MKVLLLIFLPILFCNALKTERIIGGQTAYAGQFPFAAAIYKYTNDGSFFCVGALLNQEWILTAGQCVDGATLFNIRLGSNHLNSNDENTLRLATDYYMLHPDFDPLTLKNDIGLIKLRMPIEFSTYIRPVDYLPTGDLGAYTGTTGLGWGQTSDEDAGLVDELHWVHLTVLSNEDCQLIYGSQLADTMVCVDGNYNEGFCMGDSGGPLIQDIGRGYHMQVGIASFISFNGCESTDPSGYTRIYPYVQWIYNITGM